MKKIISLVLIGMICLALTACGNTSSDDSTDNNNALSGNVTANKNYFEWSMTDETKIIGYTDEGLNKTEIVIPEECTSVQGLNDNINVKHITFENDDTIIQSDTFRNCTSLESIDLPKNLEAINESVFYGCISLNQITIPDSVTEIKSNAFSGCEALVTVNLGTNISIIGRNAFRECTSLNTVLIPDSVAEIEKAAFENCSALSEVTFGTGIKTIGEAAFQKCVSLKSVKLSEGVTDLSFWSFAYCDALKEIYLPASIESVATSSIVQIHDINVYVVEGSYMDQQLGSLMGAEYYNKQYQ